MASPPVPVYPHKPSLLQKLVAAVVRWWTFVPRLQKALFVLAVVGVVALLALITVPRKGKIHLPSSNDPNLHIGVPPGSIRTGVFWNAWATADVDPTRPVERMPVEAGFRVVLDLSALDYGDWNESVSSVSVSEATQTLLRTREWDPRLRILFVPDPQFFETTNQPLKDMTVPRTRIAAAAAFKLAPEESPFASLDQATPPEYVLARVALQLRTKKRQGWAAIGISVWDGIRPIDELSVAVCVGGPCSGQPTPVSSLRGVNSLSLATQAPLTDAPGAALHFLDLGTGSAVGVFHVRSGWPEDRFLTWRLDSSLSSLDEWLKNTLSPAFQAARGNNDELEQRGRDLFNKLFPDDEEGSEARAAFTRYVKESPRSLVFVRMMPHLGDAVPVVPLGLMVVPGLATRFVGFQVMMQTPLPLQTYEPGDACHAKWIMLIPPEQSELQEVRDQLGSGIDRWRKNRTLYEGIASFRDWARSPEKLEGPAVLMTLSHHDRDRLYFNDSESVMAPSLLRRFSPASLAILNGCGTGRTGAVGIVRQLNQRGVDSVIATATEVSPSLAAQFVTVFESEIAKPANAYTALYNSTLRLSKMTEAPGKGVYGPQALAYMLLGNGNIALCGDKEVTAQ